MKKLIFLLFSLLPSLCLGSDKEHKEKILRLLNGMYEVVSWYDGKTIHRPPDVAGRWAFFDGKIMFFKFLVEIRLRMLIKSPQKPSYRPKSCNFPPTCTLP